MHAIDVSDFYWLIGILEGEGTFIAGPPTARGSPLVRISMTDRDVVERAGALIDRAVIAVRPRLSHHKTPYVTCIKGAPAVALMRAVQSQMGSLRKVQIERAIASWHGHRTRWRRRAAHCSVTECARPGSRRGLCERITTDGGRPSVAAKRLTSVRSIRRRRCSLRSGLGPTSKDECALSWLAGLLEGEGTFSLNRYSPEIAYPVIGLQMCDAGVVARAARLLGASSVWRREPEQLGWSPTYCTAISGQHAAVWMRRLRSSMGIRRRAAIDGALSHYHPIRLVDPPAECVVAGCSEHHRGRGLCHKHYMMWSRDKAKGRAARIAPLR